MAILNVPILNGWFQMVPTILIQNIQNDRFSLGYFYIVMHFMHSISSSLANKTLDTLNRVVSTYLPLYLLGCSKASQPVGTVSFITKRFQIHLSEPLPFPTWAKFARILDSPSGDWLQR